MARLTQLYIIQETTKKSGFSFQTVSISLFPFLSLGHLMATTPALSGTWGLSCTEGRIDATLPMAAGNHRKGTPRT